MEQRRSVVTIIDQRASRCPSISLCVAVGFARASSPRPIRPAARARGRRPRSIRELRLRGLVPVGLAVRGRRWRSRIHGGAAILTSTDPTGGASSWSSAPVASGDEIVDAVSCPSVSLCVAATNQGDVFTSTNPTGGASAWTKTTIDQRERRSTPSRARRSRCASRSTTGNILTSTNPTGGASAWTKTTLDRGSVIDAVSCPSVSLCVAGRRRQRPDLDRSDRRRERVDERPRSIGGTTSTPSRARRSRCASPQTRAATSSPRPLRPAARMLGRAQRWTSQAARPRQIPASPNSCTLATTTAPGYSTPPRPAMATRSATSRSTRLAHPHLDPRRRPATTPAALNMLAAPAGSRSTLGHQPQDSCIGRSSSDTRA